ncbi:murein L,D-transpeptidase catalytic domain family protein [Sphingomonas mollis]|uniref:Murein L,D-transpeptidase catalytic domain family protein n=1 Tax=Sphingomonas mollis TaxID=2795726 RepID=A0ABS0XKK4_9SPHN|nr:murein L,D-transpeptidase catalytic domain family protein [Sphingomonas sp. BT553]MBJ6120568.1 murein L,D-transpeptidase catalytic domain family protein [Sphingomonas sp. BT553]
MHDHDVARARRAFLKTGLTLAGTIALPGAVACATRDMTQIEPTARIAPAPLVSARVVRPELLRNALAALNRHGARIAQRDQIAIADFTAGSDQARFHLVDLISGRSQSLLVAHGSGSDPAHTGYVERFSNDFGSNASSEGAFVTADYYVGKHGRSQRLMGLDPTNCNALGRAIVVHSAWYANPDMIRTHGVLGRSQGCFAVGEDDLDRVFANLGPGRMIYSAKV